MVWGGLETPTQLPHTTAISEEHTGGFFAPRTLKGHVQPGVFRSGVNFYIRERGSASLKEDACQDSSGHGTAS